MKKHQFLIISLCLAYVIGLVLVTACCFQHEITLACDNSSYDNVCNGITELDDSLDLGQACADLDTNLNFPNQYFRNLTYHGINIKGTCPYIAIGMFLSYYDTYWNDDIIPDCYDRQAMLASINYDGYDRSPGIYDVISNDNSVYVNDFTYKNYMLSQTANNFHAYLLSIGNSLGYIGSNADNSFGLPFDKTYNVLNEYITRHTAANSENFYYTYVNHVDDYETYSANMLQDIKTYVKLGQVVIVSIEGHQTAFPSNRAGHVIIVYDYDENTDTLYGHFGLGERYNHWRVLGEMNVYTFTHVKGYIVASPYESSHSHSNNYLLPSGDTVCSCQLSSHEHRYHYDSATETQHRRYCYCGVSSYQAHVFSGSSGRFVFCEKCKYRKLNDGGIIDIPNPCSTTPEILEDMEKIHEMLHNLNLEHRCC